MPVPDLRIAADADEAASAAAEIGYPLALKLSSPALQHKSDAGALELGIASPDELRDAVERLLALPAATGAELLVERMAPPGVELLVAARADAVVPALVVGLGGIWTEVLDDVAIIPLPASPARVERSLRGLRGSVAAARRPRPARRSTWPRSRRRPRRPATSCSTPASSCSSSTR